MIQCGTPTMKKGLPWTICKGFDTFLSISEFIPKNCIKDTNNIVLELSVNRKVQQRDSTNLMLFPLSRILRDVSHIMALEVGNLIVTGTPKGVGSVVPGDIMIGKIEDEEENEIPKASIIVSVEESASEYVYLET
ncbi:unnamed protein product [Clonostachys rosea]|uniref:Fumarylacetoacetase-like C-terminal domain-containing protein n=1 Tax=Bionectria ochroleuca TaxID=29856 RepID=A0ABY6UIZ5_BIOOC|nr:unnamed protein product [Clonostachys rosea]